jgi:threonine/homoserine/homoserine lactone efflux protein
MISVEFLLTSLVVVVVPGTGVIYTVSMGLAHRRRASLAAALGCTAGIVPHLTAGILGLSALMHMSARAFQVLKLAGALYLLYLAWGMWQDRGSLTFNQAEPRQAGWRIALKGVMINLLNPKLTLFFLAFLPQFVSTAEGAALGATQQMVGLSAIFMAMTFVIFALYGLLASAVSNAVARSAKALRRVRRAFALVFIGLAAKLALTEQ